MSSLTPPPRRSGSPSRRATEFSSAFGADQTSVDARPLSSPTLMTRTRLERSDFAAMHGSDMLYFPPDLWPWVSPMRRREFITLLGGALISRPILANAQPAARMRTVGVLMGLTDDAETQGRLMAF